MWGACAGVPVVTLHLGFHTDQGSNLGPRALGVWNLSHRATKEVPIVTKIFLFGHCRKAKPKENKIYLQVQTSELNTQAAERDASQGTAQQK